MSQISTLLALSVCIVLLAGTACNHTPKTTDRTNQNQDSAAGAEPGSYATVVVDFSASIAPLTQADRLALKETARALADLTTQDWPPPTTIVWRKIGAASTTLTPLCETLEYKRSIVGAANTAEGVHAKLQTCAESVVLESRAPGAQEPFTDIVGGIMMAAQNWAPMHGKKTLIIFSDFLEDLPKASHPIHLELHGEAVLLLHRPGTTEGDDTLAYLSRIKMWKERLLAAGAQSVATLPTFRATFDNVEQAVTQQSAKGTTIALINDLVPSAPDQTTASRAVTTLAAALAKASSSWAAPVNAGWFAARRPAWRTIAVAPVVYTPRIARRANELNTTETFRIALEEMGIALQKQNDGGRGDIDGALRLITDSETAPSRYLVLLSDFLTPPPGVADTPLRGEQVLLVYRAGTTPDGAGFFDRLRKWQQYFKSTGAVSVCALDITTITESAINTCMHS
jgi:hypothetical protein